MTEFYKLMVVVVFAPRFFCPHFAIQTCWQKEAVLKPENNQKITLTDRPIDRLSGCLRYNTSTLVYKCKSGRSFRSARQRWWYIALDNCASSKVFGMKNKKKW